MVAQRLRAHRALSYSNRAGIRILCNVVQAAFPASALNKRQECVIP